MPFGLLGPFGIIIPAKYFPAICKIDSHFENGRQTDNDKNHRIIGLRNLAKASAAQKLSNCDDSFDDDCCVHHTALHVSTMWVGKCTKPFLRGKMLHTQQQEVGVPFRNWASKHWVSSWDSVFFSAVQNLFLTLNGHWRLLLGLYETRRPLKPKIQYCYRIILGKHIMLKLLLL